MRADAEHVDSHADWAAFFAEPSTTGDPRWDALLAGAVEQLHLDEGEPAPAWTRGHALRSFWFVTHTPSLDAYVFAHSPMQMQVRGVMIDPADLEPV